MGIYTKGFGLGAVAGGIRTVQGAAVEPVRSMCFVQADGSDNSATASWNHCSGGFLCNTAAAATTLMSLLPARRLWTLGSAQRAIVSRPAGPLPKSEAALRKKEEAQKLMKKSCISTKA